MGSSSSVLRTAAYSLLDLRSAGFVGRTGLLGASLTSVELRSGKPTAKSFLTPGALEGRLDDEGPASWFESSSKVRRALARGSACPAPLTISADGMALDDEGP